MNEQTLHLHEYVNDLHATITDARFSFDIWWTFRVDEDVKEYSEQISRYQMFFGPTIEAHLLSCLVRLYRIYEKRKDTISITQLLLRAKSNTSIQGHVLSEIKSDYEQKAKPIWIKVNILRNEVYGHRSNEKSVDDAFKKAGVTPGDLRELISVTEELLNKFTLNYNDSTHAFNLSPKRDTFKLLKELKSCNG